MAMIACHLASNDIRSSKKVSYKVNLGCLLTHACLERKVLKQKSTVQIYLYC